MARGRPRTNPTTTAEVLEPSPEAAKTLVELLAKVSPERREKLIDALFEAASGCWMWAGEAKPRGLNQQVKRVKLIESSGEEVEGWIALRPPDSRAAQLLLEHSAGKPAVREATAGGITINLIHSIPRPGDIVAELAVVPADGAPLGIGAALVPPDPEDVPLSAEAVAADIVELSESQIAELSEAQPEEAD